MREKIGSEAPRFPHVVYASCQFMPLLWGIRTTKLSIEVVLSRSSSFILLFVNFRKRSPKLKLKLKKEKGNINNNKIIISENSILIRWQGASRLKNYPLKKDFLSIKYANAFFKFNSPVEFLYYFIV